LFSTSDESGRERDVDMVVVEISEEVDCRDEVMFSEMSI